MIEFLAPRAVPGVEEVVDGVYRRSLRLAHGAGTVEVSGDGEPELHLDDERDRIAAEERWRSLFGLDQDPRPAARALWGDPVIGHLVRANRDQRVPGTVDRHELAFRAVLGQQVSVARAAALAGRLTAEYGERLDRARGGVTHLFPLAHALAAVDPESLPMPRARGRALTGLARALDEGDVDLDGDAEAARAALLALPGIGPWTVEYVAMRALRDPDAFPASDLGVRHALERLGATTDAAERWRPYRAYAVMHLWSVLA